MTEQERIDSIRHNGGTHIKTFKQENITYAMCLAAVESDGEALQFIPPEFRTREVYETACKNTGSNLKAVPEKFMSRKICKLAVASNGYALQYVPEKDKTPEMCKIAIVNEPQAYRFTPLEYITPKFVVDVVHKSKPESISSLPDSLKRNSFYHELIKLEPELIWYIPRKALTATIGKTAIKKMGYPTVADAVKEDPKILGRLHPSLYDHDSCLNFVQSEYFLSAKKPGRWNTKQYGYSSVTDEEKGRLYLYSDFNNTYSLPDMMKWKEVALPILRLDGYSIKFLKKGLLDEDLCYAAIDGNPNAFKLIPEEFKTKELCRYAFEKEPFNIEYFPKEFITPELAKEAVEHSGFILKHMPEEFRTKEVCMIAVSDEGNGGINEVPRDVLDKDICIAWLKNSRYETSPLDYIPEELRDYDVYLAAVKLDGNELERVPKKFITEELCLEAIKNNNHAAKFVPDGMFTKEMARVMVEHSDSNFECIPTDLLDEEICLKAISHGGRYGGTVLKIVPEKMRTQRVCAEAVKRSPWSLADVPEDMVTFDMLVQVAAEAPGRLIDNFPERFREPEIIEKMIEKSSSRAEEYLKRFI